ncbi:MAG: murein biosynthesis integral membrane protein MurJ [Pseudolabrys sp.]
MSLARNVATVGIATMLSRVLGFARDVLIAAVFGSGVRADAFFVAFQLVNLVRRVLAEGALNAATVPLYLRARDEGGAGAAAAFAGRMVGSLAVLLSALVIVFAVAMPAVILILAPGFTFGGERMTIAVDLARLMLPYLALAGPLAVMMGVLNANHRFATAAFATAAFNATMLAALVVIYAMNSGDSQISGRILAVGVACAGVSQLVLVGAAIWIGPERITPLTVSFGPQVRRFVALAVPGLIAAGIPQITVIGATIVASSERSAVSWIYYANRLVELPLGIVGIAIGTVLVPALTHATRNADRAESTQIESRGIEIALGLALPSAAGLMSLAEPIVRILFQRGAFSAIDTAATAAALAAFAGGLPGHVLVKTFSPAFFAREDTKTPMHAALFGFVIAIGGSIVLMPLFGHVGIAAAIALSGWASAAMLGFQIARRFGFSLDPRTRSRIPRIALAAVVMGLAVEAGRAGFPQWTSSAASPLEASLGLCALIVAGFAVYLGCLSLLRVTTPAGLLRALRRRL